MSKWQQNKPSLGPINTGGSTSSVQVSPAYSVLYGCLENEILWSVHLTE